MSTLDNIISFPCGEPFTERFPEFEPSPEPVEVELVDPDAPLSLVKPEQTKALLDRIDRLRLLVEQGRISEMVFVGQDPVSGHYLTELCLDPAINRSELFGWVGILETLKLEINENACMAPVIDLAGTVIDPYSEPNK